MLKETAVPSFSGEKEESGKEKGQNVAVRSYYFRHAEKMAGIIGTVEGGISKSSISPKGSTDAFTLGAQLEKPAKDGYKMRWSGNPRSRETGERQIQGYLSHLNQEEGEVRQEYKERVRVGLYGEPYPKDFLNLYMSMFDESLRRILKRENIDMEEYKKLGPEQQADLAEEAEEPIIKQWIDDENSRLRKEYSLDEAASIISYMVRNDINMADRLKSGSEIDTFNMTHKVATEPFLMKTVILETGEKPSRLEDIGGSLGLDDGWRIDTKTDSDGRKTVKLFIYRVERSGKHPRYSIRELGLDMAELDRLAEIESGKRRYEKNS